MSLEVAIEPPGWNLTGWIKPRTVSLTTAGRRSPLLVIAVGFMAWTRALTVVWLADLKVRRYLQPYDLIRASP